MTGAPLPRPDANHLSEAVARAQVTLRIGDHGDPGARDVIYTQLTAAVAAFVTAWDGARAGPNGEPVTVELLHVTWAAWRAGTKTDEKDRTSVVWETLA